MRKLTMMLPVLLCALALTACGDDGESKSGDNNSVNNTSANNASECGEAGRTGVTDCIAAGALMCQAGQYCNDAELVCSVGCTSDNNCAGNQFCDLSGGAPGTCLPCTEFSSNNDNNTGINNTGSNSSGDCETIIDELIRCTDDVTSDSRALAIAACGEQEAWLEPLRVALMPRTAIARRSNNALGAPATTRTMRTTPRTTEAAWWTVNVARLLV